MPTEYWITHRLVEDDNIDDVWGYRVVQVFVDDEDFLNVKKVNNFDHDKVSALVNEEGCKTFTAITVKSTSGDETLDFSLRRSALVKFDRKVLKTYPDGIELNNISYLPKLNRTKK